MYTYISDLPPHVRNVLSVGRQEDWLHEFRLAVFYGKSETEAYHEAWNKVLLSAFEGEIPEVQAPTSPAQQTGGGVVINVYADENTTDTASASANTTTKPKRKRRTYDAGGGGTYAANDARSYINAVTFELDENNTSWIQAMPLGAWMHPVHGKIDITPERVMRFAQNVKANVRGQQLDIDVAHKEDPVFGQRAVGWVADADPRNDGLWLQIQWTNTGAQLLRENEFRYFSPEFQDEWMNPATGVAHKDVLFGGAITNRPFLKGILPINLAEFLGTNESTGGQNADSAQVWYGSQSTTVKAQEAEMAEVKELSEKVEEQSGLLAEQAKVLAEQSKLLDELKKSLAAKDEENAEIKKTLAETVTALRETEVDKKLAEWKTLPPTVDEKLRAFRLSLVGEQAIQFDDIMTEIATKGTVTLTELGSSRESDEGEEEESLVKLAEARATEKNIQFGEALRQVAAENPKLASKHKDSVKTVSTTSE